MTDGPLIVQSDKTVLLEVDHEQAGAARTAIALRRTRTRTRTRAHLPHPTPLALWNARAAGPTPSRSSTHWSPTPGTRCPRPCWSTSSTPWAATADCNSSSTPPTA